MLLVTIDDLGLSHAVNAAAARCTDAGVVGCLSLMATGPSIHEAFETASSPDLQISVHLNCIEPPFLTDVSFPSSVSGWMFRGNSLSKEVRAEWRAQIELVLSSGLMVTRLDSHRHAHMVPGLRDVILDLAEEYGAGTIRSAVLPDRWARTAGPILDRLGRSLRKRAAARGIGTPEKMLGFSRSGNVTRDYLLKYGDVIEKDIEVELVMHPAEVPVWSEGQTAELALMTSDWFRDWMVSLD